MRNWISARGVACRRARSSRGFRVSGTSADLKAERRPSRGKVSRRAISRKKSIIRLRSITCEATRFIIPAASRKATGILEPGRTEALIEPEKLKTESEWTEAGRRVFDELDFAGSRSYDPEFRRKIRSKSYLEARKTQPLPDGTISGLRWVVTEKGVALAFRECAGCHIRWIPGPVADGKPYPGAPDNTPDPNLDFNLYPYGASNYLPDGDSTAMVRWRGHFVPWVKNDIHERIKTMPEEEWNSWQAASNAPGMQARWDGSIYYPTKMPDLIGIQDRKYFDHTATHRNRGIEDLMRYAAQVDAADSPNFGPYDILPRHDRRVPYRRPDEAWYALAKYIYSLQPPPNPNKFDAAAAAGQKLFATNCAGCHTPPLYTNKN